MTRLRIAVGLALTLALIGAAFAASAAAVPPGHDRPALASAEDALLPDLDVLAPYQVSIQVVKDSTKRPRKRFLLVFGSAAQNLGAGPLVIRGDRATAKEERMGATQLVRHEDGTTSEVNDVGILRYVQNDTHEHWHLMRFMRYELRKPASRKLIRPDRKTGFCLGDRYRVTGPELPGQPAEPIYRFSHCGRNEPGAFAVEEGISVGWGDDYEPFREGQFVDVTGVKAGRYDLVHRVNSKRRLLELDYGNNASSVLLRLTWPKGPKRAPRLALLETCPDTARCPAP